MTGIGADPSDNDRQRLVRIRRARAQRTGHEVIARSLVRQGITHVFGVPGAPVSETMGTCAAAGLRVIGHRNQEAAVLASAAFNYFGGALRSAVIVSSGPAVTSCTTGLLVATDNRWPVLVIGGRVSLTLRGRGAFQDLDGAGLFAPLIKSAVLVSDTRRLADAIADGCRAAGGERPGAVYLDVTEDALAGSAALGPDDPTVERMPTIVAAVPTSQSGGARASDSLESAQAIAALARAARPVLLIGDAIRWCDPWILLARLVADHAIPFATSPLARGFLPDDHPQCLNDVRGPMLAGADLLLLLGARFDWTFRFGNEVGANTQIVCVGSDALETTRAFGRGIAVSADAATFLADALGRLEAERVRGGLAVRDRGWIEALRQRSAEHRLGHPARFEPQAVPMSPYQWLAELRGALPEHVITILDGNVAMTIAQSLLPVKHPVTRVTPGHNGCMGTGIPFAIGARLAHPDTPVVVVIGDFAFGRCAFELETAIRHSVPIVVIVANNGGNGGVLRQRKFFPAGYPGVAQFVAGVRHDQFMSSLGGASWRVERPGELGSALAMALAHGGPSCIDVLTDQNTMELPVV